MKQKLLIIGHTFPEAKTTAAGIRILQLIDLFLEANFEIVFATTSEKTEFSADFNGKVRTETIRLNDASFDSFIQREKPQIVLFDRFMTEEQFGWRVSENCPEALKILDTEDLHLLRKARQEAIKNGLKITEADLFSESAKREIASILRCDLSLIISEFEVELLQTTFKISSKILYYLPLFAKLPSKVEINELPTFDNREHFVTIGNFQHAPNLDSVIYLKEKIWPLLKAKIPSAELHIYGAYVQQRILQMHNEREGFLIKGWAEDASQGLQSAKVCLAPLRFGAGLKGKLLSAMQAGTPAVTTPVGGEGLYGNLPIPGFVCEEILELVESAVSLYENKQLWKEKQQNGFQILQKRFQKESFVRDFIDKLEMLQDNLQVHRNENFIGQILQHNCTNALKYMSKWIEAKNKL